MMFLFVSISLFLFILYGILIEYYRRAWNALPLYDQGNKAGNQERYHRAKDSRVEDSYTFSTKISVLVPARNEEKNIQACLLSLSQQNYPKNLYEVIIIDDHSTDKTWELSTSFYHPELSKTGLRLADQERGKEPVRAHKKWAIEAGIRVAMGELIVTTDADCRFEPGWLQAIAGFYEKTGARFIAAPVRIEGKEDTGKAGKRPSFLTIFQTLDFITLQGITGAAVYKKFHSMCNGANLAYAKNAFYEVEGFRGIDNIPSGDDMLLMHKIFKKYPGQVFFLKNREAIVTTNPETRWDGFVNQRIRWASKADQYDDKRIFWVLFLVYLINLLFAGLLLASFWNILYLGLFVVLLIVKTFVEYPFVRSVAGFFGQQRLLPYFPVLQPFHIFYTIIIGWLGKFGSYRWKERKVE
ncbi:glycosyltransferase [Flavitalea flava]